MRKISAARTSRRAPGLKDSDYDHEIALVDHAAEAVTPQAISPEIPAQTDRTGHDHTPDRPANPDQTISKVNTPVSTGPTAQSGPSSPHAERSVPRSTTSASDTSTSVRSTKSKGSSNRSTNRRGSGGQADIPRVEIEGEKRSPSFSCPLRSQRASGEEAMHLSNVAKSPRR